MDTGDICADDIIRAMVGRELGNLYPTKSSCIAADDPVLEVNGLTGSIFREVSFALRRGILGLPGWWARDGARLCAVCAPLIPSVPAGSAQRQALCLHTYRDAVMASVTDRGPQNPGPVSEMSIKTISSAKYEGVLAFGWTTS